MAGPTAEEFDTLITGIIKYRDKVSNLLNDLIEMEARSLSPAVLIAILEVMAADQEIITEGQRVRTKYPDLDKE